METLGPFRSRPSGRRRALSAARREVLDLVVDAEDGVTVAEVTDLTGTHPNTAREHLDELVAAGLLECAPRGPAGRGRPPLVYRAVPSAREAGPEYRVLAEVLVEQIVDQAPDGPTRRELALRAGRRWATRRDPDDRRAALVNAMHGAEIEASPGPESVVACTDDPLGPGCRAVTLRLRECPVLDLAREYPDVVCSIHLGLLQGVFSDRPCSARITLDAFAEPGACTVTIPTSGPVPPDARALLAGWEPDA